MRFEEFNPSLESYWRSIILFGANVASYKFALGKTLLELADYEKTAISMDELALPFARHLAEHLKANDKQITSQSSTFLDAVRKFNHGEISEDALQQTTVKFGFNNVIDAFHYVNRNNLPIRFYVNERETNGRIVITDELLRLKESVQFQNLPLEVEARWRLVETAWSLQISTGLLKIEHDIETDSLFVNFNDLRRIGMTSARDALNGYQKGKCFYCFSDMSIKSNNENLADVDHFFAHSLRLIDTSRYSDDLNGIWNLVLACANCNRGAGGKFALIPKLKYLERLSRRNDFLIESHHPLRETLLMQTGKTTEERNRFLQSKYNFAKQYLIHEWESKNELEAVF